MKKILTVSIIVFIFLLCPMFMGHLFADNPPDPGGGPTGDPVGGGSPLAGGLYMLLSMGVAYGLRKFQNLKKNNQ